MGKTSTGRRGMDLTRLAFYALLLPCAVSLALLVLRGGRRDLWAVLVGLLFFQACNAFIHKRSTGCFPRLALSSLDLFTNTSVSLIHSTIVGFSVLSILMKEWYRHGVSSMYEHEELFFGAWPGAKSVLCFSFGYFFYDQVDILRTHLYNSCDTSLLIHHAVLLICFATALYRQVATNYLILTLLCELHSMFLHLHRVLQMAGVRKEGSCLVIIEWIFNWITFFMSRMVMHVFIMSKVLNNVSKFPSGIEWSLAISGMICVNIINIILGAYLFKAYSKEITLQRKQEKASFNSRKHYLASSP